MHILKKWNICSKKI